MTRHPAIILKRDNISEIVTDWTIPFPIFPSVYIRTNTTRATVEKFTLKSVTDSKVFYEFLEEHELFPGLV